jgi:hypothetical protein
MLVAFLMITSASVLAKGGKSAAPKAESYLVVQIGDDMSVVKKSDLAKLKKDAAQKYKDEMKQYNDAKKEAAKNKDKGADKAALEKPLKPKIVVKKTCKTEEEAKNWLADHVDGNKDQPKTGSSKAPAKTDAKPVAQ